MVGLFVISRVLYGMLGVRFDSSTLPATCSSSIRRCCATELLESLVVLPRAPAAPQSVHGIGLKLFGDNADAYFALRFHALGTGDGAGGLHSDVAARRGALAAIVATGLLVFSPAFVLYENWLMYTFPSAALLTISASAVHQYLATRRTRWAVAFFACWRSCC